MEERKMGEEKMEVMKMEERKMEEVRKRRRCIVRLLIEREGTPTCNSLRRKARMS
jgi:hypothetical protein